MASGAMTRPVHFDVDVTLRSGSDIEAVQVEAESIKLARADAEVFAASWKHGNLQSLDIAANEGMEWLKSAIEEVTTRSDRNALNVFWVLRTAGIRPPTPVTRLRLDASALRSDVQLQGWRHGRLLGTTGEGLPLAVERLRKSAIFKKVLSGLQEVYPRIEDVDTVHLLPGQVALRFKEELIEEGLGQANVSDGVMHALALLIALEGTAPSGALAIEEPENALHPWALRKLMDRAQRASRFAPLLLTTHSPTLINAVNDPEALYVVDNDRERGTVVTPALDKESALRAILAESGQKLGDLWLDGTIGGIPEEGA